MKLRNVLSVFVVALSLVGCAAKDDKPKQLPQIDQAIEDYKNMADPKNPKHAELIAADYQIVGVLEEYVAVGSQTPAIAATVWVKLSDPDRPLISVSGDNKYVQLRYYGQAWRCNIPADNTWGAEALTVALRRLYASSERTIEVDGVKQTFVCGL